jgi:PKD repeat protein
MHRARCRRGSIAAIVALVAALAGCSREPSLTALFAYSPTHGISPLAVRFDATAVPASAVNYEWDFGDGTQGAGEATTHTYRTASAATFHVVLVARDTAGRSAAATGDISVGVPSVSPPLVHFTWPFHFDAEGDDAANLNDEYLTLENAGVTPVNLGGWTVENERGLLYRIPAGTSLAPAATLTVHSGAGRDTASILHWNADGPVWNDRSDIAILRDVTGNIVDVYAYASC